jgi:hypothetical protein
MNFFLNNLNKIKYFTNKICIDKNVQRYINSNKKKWTNYKIKKTKGVIMVDLFDHPPFIHFWSYIVNFLLKKYSLKSEYFYFTFYKSFFSEFQLYLNKIKKNYLSFNVTEGINEQNFKYSKKDISHAKIDFNKIKNKIRLQEYKYKNIKIGDLIYDTYLRTTFQPTINIKDKYLFKIFLRARKIFDKINEYFDKRNVKLVIPSHTYYIQYGLLVRLANIRKIPIIIIHNKARGNKDFRLKILNQIFPTEHNDGYINYSKTFRSLNKYKKKLALKLGESNLKSRLDGKSKLSYLKNSPYKGLIKKKFITTNQKKSVIIFAHDFFDAPHRFRNMIFTDFYEQLKFFINISKQYSNWNWFIKPHPNHLKDNDIIFKNLKENNKNVLFLDQKTNNYQIIKNNPKFIITNNGTIAHEFAFFKIPVINTGDNPHINYSFNLHPKNLDELKNMISKIDYYKKKINFNKKKIYEFVYMHYIHNKNYKINSLIKDNFFLTKNFSFNATSKLYNILLNNNKNDKYIIEYLENFFETNKKELKLSLL